MPNYLPPQAQAQQTAVLNRLQQIQARNQNIIAANPAPQPLYQNFQPQQLSYQPPADNGAYQQLQSGAVNNYSTLVDTSVEENQNEALLQQKKLAAAALARAKANAVYKGSRPIVNTTSFGLDVHQKSAEIGMTFKGINYTVNSSIASNVQGFLKALYKHGYKPNGIVGAVKGARGAHQYGLAVAVSSNKTALPPNIGALAAKYGLAYGGSWKRRKGYIEFTPKLAPETAGWREKIVQAAKSALGTPYVWGGNSLKGGVDCSGLVQQAYLAAGIHVPRHSTNIGADGQHVGAKGLRPGDVVYWNEPGSVDHVAIWIGNGNIIEAPYPGAHVRIRHIGPNLDGGIGVRIK